MGAAANHIPPSLGATAPARDGAEPRDPAKLPTCDVLVIGGGPVGLSAAIAAAIHGMQTVVLEAQPDRAARVFALSHGARLILERLGAWDGVGEAAPIRAVHVSQRGRFGRTVLRAEELGLDAVGYGVSEQALLAALRSRAQHAGVAFVASARVVAIEAGADRVRVGYETQAGEAEATAPIVAQADGGVRSEARARVLAHDYRQCALTGEVACSGVRPDWAYERFTGKGPIALLPFAGRHALIWSVPQADAAALCALEPDGFVAALQHAYGERMGRVTLHGALGAFPLQLRVMPRLAGERHVRIGNAAQTLHPAAGQGFNLGLRDAFELALALADCRRRGADLLAGVRRYSASRRLDRTGGMLFTDFLVRMFSNDDPVLAAGRSAGLAALDMVAPAKRFLMRRMIFGARL